MSNKRDFKINLARRINKYLNFQNIVDSDISNNIFDAITEYEDFYKVKLSINEKTGLLEELAIKAYRMWSEKYGQHNYIIDTKEMSKWCNSCKTKAFTISQPNDHVEGSRTADYRILCFNCKTTELIRSNKYSNKQDLESFIAEFAFRNGFINPKK